MSCSEYPVNAELMQNPLPVLVISSRPEDHELFNVFLGGVGYSLHHAFTLAEAVATLQQCPVPVVVTERSLPDGSWIDVHLPVDSPPKPPLVIVFSDPEDASSWAQAFNVGAFDVLYRPLVEKVVEGSVTLANVRWSRSAELSSARATNAMLGANCNFVAPPAKSPSPAPARQRRSVPRKSKAHATGTV